MVRHTRLSCVASDSVLSTAKMAMMNRMQPVSTRRRLRLRVNRSIAATIKNAAINAINTANGSGGRAAEMKRHSTGSNRSSERISTVAATTISVRRSSLSEAI